MISGSIDLMLHEDEDGEILDAQVIDFKSMEGGDDPELNPALDWTTLSLQVQLSPRPPARFSVRMRERAASTFSRTTSESTFP